MPAGRSIGPRKGALQKKNDPLQPFTHVPITDPRNPNYWLLDYYRTIFRPINPLEQQPAKKALTAKGARNKELSSDKQRGINRLKIPAPQTQSTVRATGVAPRGQTLGVQRLLSVNV